MINIILDSSFNFHNPYCGISSDTAQIISFIEESENFTLQQFALSKNPLPKNVKTINTVSFLKNKLFGLFGKKLEIDTSNHDIFLCQNPNNYRISGQTKKITRIHDVIPLEHPKKVPFLSHLLFKKNILYNTQEQNSFFVCDSMTTKKKFLKIFPELQNQTHVIPCSSAFLNENIHPEKPNIDATDFFLAVSSLEPKKNVIRLLKAYEQLIMTNNDCRPFILVGNTGWKNKKDIIYLEFLKKKYSNKIFHLQNISIEQLAWLYKNCYCFIMPSVVEGFGIPVLDALAFNKPILCSNIEVFQEIAGNAALYFNPLSITDIKLKLQQIDSDINLHKSLTKKSSVRSKKFAPNKIKDSWHNLIQGIYEK